jgi:hypothetical protein
MTIELNDEMVIDIVEESLNSLLQRFEEDIKEVVSTGKDVNFCSDDIVVELNQLMKNRDALKQVLSLYTI